MEACVCGLPRDGIPPIHPLPATHPLLTNNDPPAESETAQILDFLAGARKRCNGLDSNIAAVAAILDTLVKARDLLAHDIRSHEGIISPLRQLPTEILCRILVMARKPLANFELPKAPWYLGQISKRWREIAIGIPVLWISFWVCSVPTSGAAGCKPWLCSFKSSSVVLEIRHWMLLYEAGSAD
ncbi:hypothetical protein C8R47DRAFT_1147469 [Mycena vitilis]|nr:hypothetical protein C8R47DRAFT_1147469 [Mycena vitilis]